MVNIDYIMGLLDWNQSIDDQNKGISLSREIKCINVFLQPCNEDFGKNVWDNCAKILSERTDEELSPYLIELMEWLQDMNWPGAFCILERLHRFADAASFQLAYSICTKYARAIHDDVWENNLRSINTQNCNH